jgi:hypothetical protein
MGPFCVYTRAHHTRHSSYIQYLSYLVKHKSLDSVEKKLYIIYNNVYCSIVAITRKIIVLDFSLKVTQRNYAVLTSTSS